MAGKFNAPIPGESLTREPGNSPWEQPPLYADVQQALAFHLKNLSDPDRQDDAMFLLERGFPLNVLVDSMCEFAVMNGVHTIDVSMIISPVIHEYLLSLAEAQDIKVKEDDGPTNEEKFSEKKKKRLISMLEKELGESELGEEIAPELGAQVASDATLNKAPDAPPQGLAEETAPPPFIKRP